MSDDMTFWDHLDVLRGVLVRIAVVVFALGVAAFIAMPWIFDHIVLAPCYGDFPLYRLLDTVARASGLLPELADSTSFSVNVTSLELTSQFFIHISASCWVAVIFGFPIIIYELWSFISPALYPHEKRGVRKAFVWGNLMFYAGVAMGYFVAFPLAVRFLADYHLSDKISGVVSLESYMDNMFTMLLLMGIVFELPLLAWLLGKMGFLTRGFFKRYRRHAILGLTILAAAITPTGDPFTLIAVFAPIYCLWELSARLVPRAARDDGDEATPRRAT